MYRRDNSELKAIKERERERGVGGCLQRSTLGPTQKFKIHV